MSCCWLAAGWQAVQTQAVACCHRRCRRRRRLSAIGRRCAAAGVKRDRRVSGEQSRWRIARGSHQARLIGGAPPAAKSRDNMMSRLMQRLLPPSLFARSLVKRCQREREHTHVASHQLRRGWGDYDLPADLLLCCLARSAYRQGNAQTTCNFTLDRKHTTKSSARWDMVDTSCDSSEPARPLDRREIRSVDLHLEPMLFVLQMTFEERCLL